MRVSSRYAGLAAKVAAALIASAASAAAANAGPTPVSPPPPSHHCCQHGHGPQVHTPSIRIGGPRIHIGGPRVHVGGIYLNNQINVNVNASASASAIAVAGAQAQTNTIVYAGGGFIPRGAPPAATAIGALGLAGEYEAEEESYMRMVEGWRIVRAVCVDDNGTPHPASRPERDERVAEGFEGEIFRCMPGTALQATLGWRRDGADDFEGGTTIACRKGQALRYRSGDVYCAEASAERDCHERSLLRLYGPGVRLIYMRYEERYTEVRERRRERRTASSLGLMLDGGVGGYN